MTCGDMWREIQGYGDAVSAFNKKISMVEETNTALTYEIEMHKKNNDVLTQDNEQLKEQIKILEERLWD